MTEVYISSLRITAEDDWLKNWIKDHGDSVEQSPHYRWLMGETKPMDEWMFYRKLNKDYITKPLMQVFKSLLEVGQLEPIKIYKDMRINTGHKRSACLLFMGKQSIRAELVPDDFKL